MRLKRRLMIVVRLLTDGAQCKPGASFSAKLQLKKTPKNYAACSTGANLCRHELLTTERSIRLCLNSNFFSAYLCVPLRFCGKQVVRAHLPQRRRGTQRYAEKNPN